MDARKSSKAPTSWGGVADWYADYLGGDDTYQSKVILPNLIRVLAPEKGERILDLACGEGFFSRELAKAGADVTGADIAPELVAKAKEAGQGPRYVVAPANDLSFAKNGEFDAVLCVLALQNIEDLAGTFREAKRVLKAGGRFVMVLNHPAFRVIKRSSWGWDEAANVQYRRIDGYLSAAKVPIDMHPGKSGGKKTVSYHRSLQDFFKALAGAGFAVTKLEEWNSHKTSEQGPRQKAEDTARKEIPLFMLLEAKAL
ncbi:MAG TPA: class I SAM-dependent methyltransferase [Candidatus Paceibacterota bacterium]|nr:class I SAM-dependent methyltransferase [Candidatus Paceibacterota bacterium]